MSLIRSYTLTGTLKFSFVHVPNKIISRTQTRSIPFICVPNMSYYIYPSQVQTKKYCFLLTSSHNFVKMHQILWPRTAKRLGLGQKWKWFWKAWTMAFHALVVVKWVAAPPSGRKSTKRGNSPFWGFKNDEKTRFCALRAFFMRNFRKIFLASILGLQQRSI